MATVVFSNPARCTGGGHTSFDVSFNGTALGRFTYDTDDVLAPLANLTQAQREAAALVIAKIHFSGKTRQQAITETNAGPVTVTI